jgi:hypothetical protein
MKKKKLLKLNFVMTFDCSAYTLSVIMYYEAKCH